MEETTEQKTERIALLDLLKVIVTLAYIVGLVFLVISNYIRWELK